MNTLIGITGRDRNAAGFIATYLCLEHGFEMARINSPFEEALAALVGKTPEEICRGAAHRAPLLDDLPPPKSQWADNPTVNDALLILRTGFAAGQHEDFTTLLLHRRLDQLVNLQEHQGGIIVPDILLEKEAAFVRDMGGIVFHMRNENMDRGAGAHITDFPLQPHARDHVIHNNGALADLQLRVEQLLTALQSKGAA